MTSILKLEKISKSFPGVKALQGIDLEIERGEIHALLGENGAGKSTLMKILAGIYPPDDGQIVIDGQPRKFANYNDANAAGVGIIFQEFSLVPDLNAAENMYLGREMTTAFGSLARAKMRKAAAAIFERLAIHVDPDVPVRSLSVAQQQFVEIAKALSLDAKILILDEPTATLTPTEAEHLFTIMRELKKQGVAMIFISHHLDEIFEVCDRITVLRDGHWIGMREVAATHVHELVELMVGRKIENSFPPRPAIAPSARVVLDVEELQIDKGGPVNAFRLREGEILGFAGLVGSGRTETALAVLGAAPAHRRRIMLDGRPVELRDAADALAHGMGILPESRKTDGLIVDFSIRQNISLNNLPKYTRGGVIDRRRETDVTAEIVRKVGVKAPDIETRVGTLSGGNQQKVVIARWLNHHVKILFFDEPTRGIDVGAKAEIYLLMRELTAQGYAIVMISSELPEVVGMCDRVAVFKQGAIVATLEGEAIDSNEIMRHATAGSQDELA